MNIEQIIDRNFVHINDEYVDFATKKSECRECSVYEHYEQVGQSEGNVKNPTFMFIGEALGQDEVKECRPFIGVAGQRLRRELRKYPKAFNRGNCVISNVLACRPQNNVFPRDSAGPYWVTRKGSKLDVDARELINFCATNWLRKEIALLKPKVIVVLGGQALDYVRGDRGITANRGAWKFLGKFRAWSMATYHPSYVLRCGNDPSKPYVVKQFGEDIKKIAETWYSTVNDDEYMKMDEEEWKRTYALQVSGQAGIFSKPSPIDDDDF